MHLLNDMVLSGVNIKCQNTYSNKANKNTKVVHVDTNA